MQESVTRKRLELPADVALGHASMINGLYDRAVRLIDQARERGLYDHYIWNIGLQARLEARAPPA
jgi:hypothetical protein